MSTFWDEIDLQLLPGEEVLFTGEPDRKAIVNAAMAGLALVNVFMFFMFIWFLPVQWLMARESARRHRYFVTNQRVIVTDGLVGYKTRSVPLERISDVQIGCTWAERMFEIRSVIVRDMTGEAQGGAKMQGVANANAIQELILNEVRRVNATTGEVSDVASPSTETVRLLREIRDALVEPRTA